jgi:hypothetical protein
MKLVNGAIGSSTGGAEHAVRVRRVCARQRPPSLHKELRHTYVSTLYG